MDSKKIYLVLCHEDWNRGHGRDPECLCLKVFRDTYKTREEADAQAKKAQEEKPENLYWSLEVNMPK